MWDLKSGEKTQTIEAGPVDVWSVSFTPDAKHIVSGSHAGKINWFSVESGKLEQSNDTRGKFILSIACVSSETTFPRYYSELTNLLKQSQSPDGKYVAGGAMDGIINIFDVATGKLVHTLEGHAMPIRSLTFSDNSQLLLTASDDGQIKIYDVQDAHLVGTLSGHGSWVLSVAVSSDNCRFTSGSSDRTVKVWDLKAMQCLHTFSDHTDQVTSPFNPPHR